MTNNQTKHLSHRTDPQTSRDAAEKLVESGGLGRQQKMVFSAIVEYSRGLAYPCGFTSKGLSSWSSFNYHLIARRLNELEKKGLIEITDRRRDNCAVWKLKEKA